MYINTKLIETRHDLVPILEGKMTLPFTFVNKTYVGIGIGSLRAMDK